MRSCEKLLHDLLQFDWRTNPCAATVKGIHGWDDELPSADMGDIHNQIKTMHRFKEEFEVALLLKNFRDVDEMMDLEVGHQYLVRALAELEILEPWQKNPMHCLGTLASGINCLLVPAEDQEVKERALVSRLTKGAAFLTQAQANLIPSLIPPLWLEIAQSNAKGLRLLLTRSLPLFAGNTGREADILDAADSLIDAIDRYCAFLSSIETLAQGTYACGPEYFNIMLKHYYLVDMDVDQLLVFGERKVAEFESALVKQAAEMEPGKHWTELIEETKIHHPTAGSLLEAYGAEKDRATAFVRQMNLVSIPDGEECTMAETPLYARPTTPLGSMNTTRPYTPGLHSLFNITPVDLTASPERQKQHLSDNNYPFIQSIAFHEVIPGHHLQACKHKLQPSYFRRNFYNIILVEGWGLYTEDLMAETGYLKDPLLNLIRLKNALWRAVRVVVDVGLHTQGMPFAEAVSLLQHRIRQGRHMAVGEARRYTVGPTYPSSYMLGRDQILALRTACQEKWGVGYTLRRFHDELLSYGSMPVAMSRREMLKG
jgi:hypothetical protein